MKLSPSSLSAALLVLTPIVLAGCGGSSAAPTLPNAAAKTKVAQLLKDVFAGREQFQSAPGTRGASKSVKLKSKRPLIMTREEGDLEVGQVSKFSEGFWGRIEAVSYDTFEGYRSITELKYKYYRDELLTQYYGFQNYAFRVEADGIGYNISETELNEPSGPPYYKKEETRARLGNYYKNDFVEITDLSGNGGPDRVRIEGGSEWLGGDTSTFYVRYPIRGELFSASGQSFANGGLEVAWNTASGYRVEITYDRDWEAVFSIKGDNPLLPASGLFDSAGKGSITFNDGTRADFDYYQNEFFVTR